MWGRCREFCSTTDSTVTTDSRVTLAHCAEFPDVEWFQDLKMFRRDPLAQFSCYLSEAQTKTFAVRIVMASAVEYTLQKRAQVGYHLRWKR